MQWHPIPFPLKKGKKRGKKGGKKEKKEKREREGAALPVWEEKSVSSLMVVDFPHPVIWSLLSPSLIIFVDLLIPHYTQMAQTSSSTKNTNKHELPRWKEGILTTLHEKKNK